MGDEKKKILQHIANTLQGARTARKLSYRELSALSSVDHPQIAELETGTVSPNLVTLFKLAAALKIPVTEFFDLENPFTSD